MEVNSHAMSLWISVKCMELKHNMQQQELLNKMGWLKGKNKHVQEITRKMINEAHLLDNFQTEAFYTDVYVLNRGKIITNSDKTPYELWKGRPSYVKHFRIFGSKCYIKRDDEDLGKFYCRLNEVFFLGYSSRLKSYMCYNKRM